MDGRASVVLALALAAGVLGCAAPTTLPLVPSPPQGKPVEADPPPDDGKPHKPHASTFVAAGELAEKAAEDPQRGAADRANLLEQARKAFQQAIATDPDYLPAHAALARLYLNQGDPVRAVATYQKALKAHPKEASLWYGLGMCYSRQKKWAEAVAHLRKAHELDPENRPYGDTLGYCLARAGRFDESLACFREQVGEAQAQYNLARMLHHMGRDDLSRQHLQLALKADPQLAPARQLLARLANPAANGVVPASGRTGPDDQDDGDDDR